MNEKRKAYNRQYMREYRAKNKERERERMREGSRKYRETHREEVNRYLRKHQRDMYQKFPWLRTFHSARARCKKPSYIKKGIEFLMSVEDFKILWFRDKAYEMKTPEIHRKKKHYILEDCEYLDKPEHRKIHAELRKKK
jgi:hypothetical protein